MGLTTFGRDIEKMITIDNGSVVRIIDIFPGKESLMYRTDSIDCGIVLQAEIEMEDGCKTTVQQGGIIVQRGAAGMGVSFIKMAPAEYTIVL